MRKIPFYRQQTNYYCGPAVLAMALGAYGQHVSQRRIAKFCGATKRFGTSHAGLLRTVKKFSLSGYAQTNTTLTDLMHLLHKRHIVIVNYIEPTDNENHYAIVTSCNTHSVTMHDPWNGKNFRISVQTFLPRWKSKFGKSQRWLLAITQKSP